MIRRHAVVRVLLMGLICLHVAACNGWQAAGPPPRGSDAESIDVEIDPQSPADNREDASPSDEAAKTDDPRNRLRPYYEWTESETAADALGRMGAAAVPSLIESLHDSDPAVRFLGSRVLTRIGPEAVIAVPDLIQLLDDEDEQVRRAATRALGQIGPAAAESAPALIRLLRETAPANSNDVDAAVELDERTSQ